MGLSAFNRIRRIQARKDELAKQTNSPKPAEPTKHSLKVEEVIVAPTSVDAIVVDSGMLDDSLKLPELDELEIEQKGDETDDGDNQPSVRKGKSPSKKS